MAASNTARRLLRRLERLANAIAARLDIQRRIRVKVLTRRVDPQDNCFALWDHKLYTMWVRLNDPNGQLYTWRHLVTCVVHELTHAWYFTHTKGFRREQRRVARVARAVQRGTL